MSNDSKPSSEPIVNEYGAGPWAGAGSAPAPVDDGMAALVLESGLWRWTLTLDRLTTSSEETRPLDSNEFRLDVSGYNGHR